MLSLFLHPTSTVLSKHQISNSSNIFFSKSPKVIFHTYCRFNYVCLLQGKPLNVITLGQRESDNINRMITISNRLLKQKAFLLVIWDLLNLGQFDRINPVFPNQCSRDKKCSQSFHQVLPKIPKCLEFSSNCSQEPTYKCSQKPVWVIIVLPRFVFDL
jgi:hypothetical protein